MRTLGNMQMPIAQGKRQLKEAIPIPTDAGSVLLTVTSVNQK